MIALDTNVVVRFLVEDDQYQSQQVAALWQRSLQKKETLFISHVVLCEIVWVLQSSYHFSRAQIAGALHLLCHARGVDVRDIDLVHRAMALYKKGKGDFSDYLLLQHSIHAGCDHVVTFDKALLKEPHWVSP